MLRETTMDEIYGRFIMKFFWYWFHKKYAKPYVGKISIPMTILSRFDWHYFLYDEKGDVQDGARTMREALRKHRETGLYVTRVWD